ncbi:MAG TPA: FtsW/RodA/SpoVE family cell cycle protein [Candidatus Saccharimonadales bacterium]|nr:FtsW/RodA/SpoVE family cell cycle protein [Candidatus Saccharimonadales bacterium]
MTGSTRLYAPRTGRWDVVMFWTTLLLLGLGMLAVYSSSAYLGSTRFGGSATFLNKQFVRALLGLLVMLGTARLDYRRWARWAWPLWGVSLGLLVALAVLRKMGGVGDAADLLDVHQVRGAYRWYRVGTVSLQPTEIAKVLTVMVLASLLAREETAFRSARSVLRAVGVLGVTAGLIVLQPNFSSATALLAVGFLMLLVAGLPWQWLAGCGLVAPLALWYALSHHGHHMKRVHDYLALVTGRPVDVREQVWQLWQSLVALGSGGLLGRGLGHGLQKFLFLPDPHTDFIFSIWGEEMGFLGAVGLLLLLALLLWRGFRTSLRALDPFGFYLAAGLSLQLAVYAGVHVAVTTGLVPTTGLPLPFISFGGSSLVMNLLTVGVLLNISRRAS